MASFLKSVLLCLFLGVWHFFPADVILLGGIFDFGATFILLSISRVLMITTYRYLVNNVNPKSEPVLIYYDPQAEDSSLASLLQQQNKYKIRGFIQIGTKGTFRLNGLTVYSIATEEDFRDLYEHMPFKSLVFPSQKGVQKEKDRLILYGAHTRVKMLVLPPMDVLGKEKNRLKALPEIRIEDLLGRDEIKINLDEIRESLKGKVVMVTGAAGSIGSELCRQLCTFGLKELILFDSAETPMHNIRLELEEKFPQAYADFVKVCDLLEDHYRDMQDMEFTVENGKLYMLQCRSGKRTAQAALKIACDLVDEGMIDEKKAVAMLRELMA